LKKVKLSRTQRELTKVLEQLLVDLHLDPAVIINELNPTDLTSNLRWAKTYLIRGSVLTNYTILDDALGFIIIKHQFGRKLNIRKLKKSKRFASFKFFILEKLTFNQKLDYVRDAHPIPKWVTADLYALNDLRNALAHSYFTERRRRKPFWKNEPIFRLEGYMKFQEDIGKVFDFLAREFFGGPLDEPEFTPTVCAEG
jgi:hypothetical protein